MESLKTDFLCSELWILSWGASVQRAGLFRRNASDKGRRAFRRRVIDFLSREVLPWYVSPVDEASHNARIEHLSEAVTELDQDGVLRKGGYRIGVAQKLLNLQLKYMWCLGLVAEPPHCPVDRVIINKTGLRNRVAWTQLFKIHDYQAVISAVREVAAAEGLSIAKWELTAYSRDDA